MKPPALNQGDTVAIIAPASNIDEQALEAGCDALRRLGYKAFYSPSILDTDLYFAGTAERRVRELHEMFERDDVKAIICARGGYGCNYLLDKIDIEVVRRNPKIFVGYSDITTLLTWFTEEARLVTFHGPMVAKDFAQPEGVELQSWQAAMSGEAVHAVFDAQVAALVEGAADGILYGGCLSMLVASLATPYEARTEGKLLFLEDVAAKPFQIDRMLMQMKLAGKFDGVRGIIVGEMLDCVQPGGQKYTLQEIVTRVVGDLNVPIVYGVRSGHVRQGNMTLPFGVRASLTASRSGVTLEIEPATLRQAGVRSARP